MCMYSVPQLVCFYYKFTFNFFNAHEKCKLQTNLIIFRLDQNIYNLFLFNLFLFLKIWKLVLAVDKYKNIICICKIFWNWAVIIAVGQICWVTLYVYAIEWQWQRKQEITRQNCWCLYLCSLLLLLSSLTLTVTIELAFCSSMCYSKHNHTDIQTYRHTHTHAHSVILIPHKQAYSRQQPDAANVAVTVAAAGNPYDSYADCRCRSQRRSRFEIHKNNMTKRAAAALFLPCSPHSLTLCLTTYFAWVYFALLTNKQIYALFIFLHLHCALLLLLLWFFVVVVADVVYCAKLLLIIILSLLLYNVSVQLLLLPLMLFLSISKLLLLLAASLKNFTFCSNVHTTDIMI